LYTDADNVEEDVHCYEGQELSQPQPRPPPPPLSSPLDTPPDLKTLVADMVKLEMQQQGQKEPPASNPKKRKRRVSRKCVTLKMKKQTEDANDEDTDSDVEFVQQSSNTARRILWQRGHAATLPSTKADIIERATVSTVADAFNPLCEFGFAIISGMPEVFAPKNRCTREQRDFINKCKWVLLLLYR
jgi:hypothetical protein